MYNRDELFTCYMCMQMYVKELRIIIFELYNKVEEVY